MRAPIGPIERLSEACAAHTMLWILCVACGHAVRLDPRKLMSFNGDVTLRELREKMRCDRCKTRVRPAIVLTDQGWRTR